MAADDASFNTSIWAMLLGSINKSGLEPAVPPNAPLKFGIAVPPSNGTPSLTYKGLLLARIEELPLIFTVVAPHGSPVLFVISNPATLL